MHVGQTEWPRGSRTRNYQPNNGDSTRTTRSCLSSYTSRSQETKQPKQETHSLSLKRPGRRIAIFVIIMEKITFVPVPRPTLQLRCLEPWLSPRHTYSHIHLSLHVYARERAADKVYLSSHTIPTYRRSGRWRKLALGDQASSGKCRDRYYIREEV